MTKLPRAGLGRRTRRGASPGVRVERASRPLRAGPLLVLLVLLLLPGAARAVNPNSNQEQKARVVKKELRYWSVDALFETHFTVIHDNEYSNDVYHVLYMRANYDWPRMGYLPPLGRFTIRADITRKYVADPDESGVLFGDMLFYWSRAWAFNIKGQQFGIRPYLMWSFPTSKLADKESNIARPTVLVALSKPLPYNLHFFVRPYGRLNWDRYAERSGGEPNIKWQLGYDMQLLYTFHLHQKLSFGGTWGQEWLDRYDSRDGYSQPWNSQYYWELFTGYSILEKPVSLGAYLTLSSGRKTVEDGVYRFHWVDRDETEVYLSINARY